jgi:hypothetical protein
MCRENKEILSVLFVFLLVCLALGALRAEEPDRWYLISEQELASIETLLSRLETDRQNWESQAHELRLKAERLETESAILNSQLSEERELYRTLETSFNGYEAAKLTELSLKDGEIAGLKEEKAAERLEKEKYKGSSRLWFFVAIALAVSWAIFGTYKVWRKFHPVPRIL